MALIDRFRLDGKVALITGASRGIGEATAVELLASGAAGVVITSRKEQNITEAAARLNDDRVLALALEALGQRVALLDLEEFPRERAALDPVEDLAHLPTALLADDLRTGPQAAPGRSGRDPLAHAVDQLHERLHGVAGAGREDLLP